MKPRRLMPGYYEAIGRELAKGEKRSNDIAVVLNLNRAYVCRILNNMVDLGLAVVADTRPTEGGGNFFRVYAAPTKRPHSVVQSLLQSQWGAQA